MIQYERFAFAAPPLAYSLWVVRALPVAGIVQPDGPLSALKPPPEGHEGYRLSISVHPYTWLKSVYHWSHALREIDRELLVENLPKFKELVGLVQSCISFDTFLSRYVMEMHGAVSEIFDTYRATSVIRVEDLPWCLIEFVSMLGYDGDALRDQKRPSGTVFSHTKLSHAVVDAEFEYCDRLGYF